MKILRYLVPALLGNFALKFVLILKIAVMENLGAKTWSIVLKILVST